MPLRTISKVDGNTLIGLLIIFLGLVFLVGNIFPDYHFWRNLGRLWPAVLILIGLYMLFGHGRLKNQIRLGPSPSQRIVGDLQLDFNNRETGNIESSQVIGDMTIDLAGSRLAAGVNRLSVSTVIGDILMLVPRSFPAKVEGKTALGDIWIGDRRGEGLLPKIEFCDDNYEQAADKLLISINGVIGDMTLRRI